MNWVASVHVRPDATRSGMAPDAVVVSEWDDTR